MYESNDEEEYDEDEDDLILFDQENRIEKLRMIGVNVGGQQSQRDQAFKLNQFFKQENSEIQEFTNKNKFTPKKAQIVEHDLTARKLRLHNATKYFQLVKLEFLKDVVQSIKFATKLDPNRDKYQKLGLILSSLPINLLITYKQFKNINPFSLQVQKILAFFKNIFKSLTKKQDLLMSLDLSIGQVIWVIGKSLKIQTRKICFFSLSQHVDQTFYNLNFDKNKKKPKKVTKAVDKIKNKIQKKIFEESTINQQNNFVDLQGFTLTSVTQSFNKNPNDKNNKSQGQFKILRPKQILNRNLSIKKNYKQSTFQIFSFVQNKWVMFFCHDESQFVQVEIDWFKENILNAQPVVGFYALQQIDVKPEYEALFKLRKTGKIIIRDLSMYFADKLKDLAKRRQRVGIRIIMNKIFRHCKYFQPLQILTEQCSYAYSKSKQTDEELLRNQIPTSNQQLNMSDYFTIPSRIGKYFSLFPDAKPAIENFQIDQQKIYWKDDLLPLGSRMGWIDFGRMVKQNQVPLKKTENKNKKPIQLYIYEQTQVYELKIDHQGNFILDPEHFSIYVPPHFQLPENTCIIKKNIGFICNKHKFKHAKLVQGFVNSGMRVLPNQIGYLVYQKDREDILKFHQERQEFLNNNKQKRQGQNIQKMWRQLFKSLRLMDRLLL